jgi:hypothetical protein
VDRDDRIAIYELKERDEAVRAYRRLVRADLGRAYPVYSFEARADSETGTTGLLAFCNKAIVGALTLTPQWHRYELRVPADHMIGLKHNEVLLRSENGRPWRIRNDTFTAAASGGEPAAVTDAVETFRENGWYDSAPVRELREQGRVGPDTELDVAFGNGIALLGCTVEQPEVGPGERIRILTFWRCPRSVDARGLAVFLHIKRETESFQADFPFLRRYGSPRFQPYPRLFVEVAEARVPSDAPRGQHTVHIGLYRQQTGRRLRPDTALEVRNKGVVLPVTVNVR